MHKIATKIEIPPTLPLFSNFVRSAKYEKHEGNPKPNETPKRIEMTNPFDKVKIWNVAGIIEVNVPKSIHK